MAANTYGRQVVVPLTNKSGGGVIAGDVVIIDTGNNDAFTTTTTAAYTGLVGIAQETIANNAVGRVLTAGYAALVLTSGSVTRGNFGATHTVAKQAADIGARAVGAFCQFLTGGTTPDAHVFGMPDGTAASGAPTTADYLTGTAQAGLSAEIVVGTTPGGELGGTWASPTVDATHAGTDSGTHLGRLLQAARVTRTAADDTTTSSTFADATGLTSTITTGAHRVMLYFTGSGGASGSNELGLSFAVDGARVDGATYGLMATTGQDRDLSMFYLTDVLTAASHTFTVQFKVSAGTGTIFASGTAVAVLTVIETGLTS